MNITVQVTPQSEQAVRVRLENAAKGSVRGLTSGLRAAGIYVASYIKRELLSGQVVMRRSGNLSRAVFSRMESDTVAIVGVGSEAPYGRYVNDGARPHLISGNPILAFTPAADAIRHSAFISARNVKKVIAANRIFVRYVHHPGNAPRRFMELGLRASVPEIRQIVAAHVMRGMKGQEG